MPTRTSLVLLSSLLLLSGCVYGSKNTSKGPRDESAEGGAAGTAGNSEPTAGDSGSPEQGGAAGAEDQGGSAGQSEGGSAGEVTAGAGQSGEGGEVAGQSGATTGGSEAGGVAGTAGNPEGGANLGGSVAGAPSGGIAGQSGSPEAGAGQGQGGELVAGAGGESGGAAGSTGEGGSSGAPYQGCAAASFDNDSNPNTACQAWRDCDPGQYISTEGTPVSDRACSDCETGSYSDIANVSDCTTYTICEPGTHVSVAGTATTDQGCVACEEGTFSDSDNVPACTPYSPCEWGELGVGTATADQICGPGSLARQFGTEWLDRGFGGVADSAGNIIVVGDVDGDLEGSNAGYSDAFVRWYDRYGRVLRTRQFGTGESDAAYAAAVNGANHVFVAGQTGGTLGDQNYGGYDAFLREYDADGEVVRTLQFGSAEDDSIQGVAVDPDGNIYVVGETEGVVGEALVGDDDGFVRKYDPEGTVLWTHQFGSDDTDYARSIALDGSRAVYVAGHTSGDLVEPNQGNYDAYVQRYDADGENPMSWQFGTENWEHAYGIAVDSAGNFYVTGYTTGDLGSANLGSGSDAFLRKYTSAGTVLWTRQFGTSSNDEGNAVRIDDNNNIYVAGITYGTFLGDAVGGEDGFVQQYDTDGNAIRGLQFGTDDVDYVYALTQDIEGRLFVIGDTNSQFEGQTYLGDYDAYVILTPLQ